MQFLKELKLSLNTLLHLLKCEEFNYELVKSLRLIINYKSANRVNMVLKRQYIFMYIVLLKQEIWAELIKF